MSGNAWAKDPAATVLAANQPPSEFLPPDAARALQAASLTPITEADPLARERAIDQAITNARTKYPELFKKEA